MARGRFITLEGGEAEAPVEAKRERAPRAERAPRGERAPRRERAPKAAAPVDEIEVSPELAEEAAPAPARTPRARRDEPRPPKDVLTELPSQPGEWNGPVPGFLSVSAL